MREETPYAYDFLWKQLEKGFSEVRKKRYRILLEKFFNDEELKKRLQKKEDRKGRNYRGGMLEKTASVLSLALCTYDNYPELDIDLIITAIILNGFCSVYTKKECYEKIKDYPELVPFLFRKKRKKPILEVIVFDNLYKFDDKIYKQLKIKRGENDT
ncbi:hypothetical protein [Persephonella sp.]